MATIGKVTRIPERKQEFEWKILNFFSLSKECDIFYESPHFSFANESWGFRVYPNGSKSNNSVGYIELYLIKYPSHLPITLKWFLGLKTLDGKIGTEAHSTSTFEKNVDGRGIAKCVSRSELFQKFSQLVDGDVLIVFCTLEYPDSFANSIDDRTSAKCFSCKEKLDTEFISFHEKCINRPRKCPDCSKVVLLQNWLEDNECVTERVEESGCLYQDFKNMLIDGINHDLILKIGEREFRAHRDVLRARSPVFRSMLTHNTLEKSNGVINIPDCDPQAMELFLYYVYSGKVESVDQTNIIGLYYIADKYEMNDLREECAKFLKQSLCPTNFCTVIQLALKHSDSSLIDFSEEYFTNNMLDIFRTVEWPTFLKDNSSVANQLLIKSHERKE